MRIAKQWGKTKSATLPDLSYRGAIAMTSPGKRRKRRIGSSGGRRSSSSTPPKTRTIPFDGESSPPEHDARIKTQDAEWEAGEPERAALRKGEEAKVEKKLTLAQDLIVAGYKVLAAKVHPDKGGSNTAMQELNELRDDLLKVVESTYYVAVSA